MASDGKWYPPESHPDYLPPRSEPPATQRMPVPVAETPDAPATFARRPAAWHERRRVRVAGGVLGTIVVLGIIGSLCIPPPPPDLNCDDIPYRRFQVLPPDPHRLDGNDNDGLGCES